MLLCGPLSSLGETVTTHGQENDLDKQKSDGLDHPYTNSTVVRGKF